MKSRKKLFRFITASTLAVVLSVGLFGGAGTMMVQAVQCESTDTESIPNMEEIRNPIELAASNDASGPNTGEGAYPFIKVVDGSSSSETVLFSFVETTEAVNGLSYDQKSNTLTMKNFTGELISINEMGNDFVIKVEGTNNLSKLWVWGYGYGGSVKLTGTGTLNIKNNNAPGIELSAEFSKSQIYIDKNVKLNISSGCNAIHVSESTHDTPIIFASGVGISSGKVTTQSTYKPSYSEFSSAYHCSKDGKSLGFYSARNAKDGYKVVVINDEFDEVDILPWNGTDIPAKVLEKAGYTVGYSKTKLYYSNIAVKKLSTNTVSVAKATIQSVSGAKKAIAVKVKKVSGAKGYQIRYATNKKMSGAKSVYSTSLSKKITRLKSNTKYYVKIRAYKLDANGKKVYGAWSSVKSAKTK